MHRKPAETKRKSAETSRKPTEKTLNPQFSFFKKKKSAPRNFAFFFQKKKTRFAPSPSRPCRQSTGARRSFFPPIDGGPSFVPIDGGPSFETKLRLIVFLQKKTITVNSFLSKINYGYVFLLKNKYGIFFFQKKTLR